MRYPDFVLFLFDYLNVKRYPYVATEVHLIHGINEFFKMAYLT